MNRARVSVNTLACITFTAGELPSTDLRNSRLAPMEHGSMKPRRPSATGTTTRVQIGSIGVFMHLSTVGRSSHPTGWFVGFCSFFFAKRQSDELSASMLVSEALAVIGKNLNHAAVPELSVCTL